MQYLESKHIKEQTLKELYLCGINPIENHDKFIGKKANWLFERASTYWIATNKESGLSLFHAKELQNTYSDVYPNIKLGTLVRANGYNGTGNIEIENLIKPVHNKKFCDTLISLGYTPINNEITKELYKLGYLPFFNIKQSELMKLHKDGKIKLDFRISLYHIDDICALKQFVNFIKFVKK